MLFDTWSIVWHSVKISIKWKFTLIDPLQDYGSVQSRLCRLPRRECELVRICKDTETNSLLFVFLLIGAGSRVLGWVFSSLESRAHAIKGAFLFVGVKLQKLQAVKAVHYSSSPSNIWRAAVSVKHLKVLCKMKCPKIWSWKRNSTFPLIQRAAFLTFC